MNILRDRNVLARKISGGRIQNIYTIKILNKTENPRQYTLGIEGAEGAAIDGKTRFSVESGAVYETVLRVNIPRARSKTTTAPTSTSSSPPQDNPADAHRQTSKFLGPTK